MIKPTARKYGNWWIVSEKSKGYPLGSIGIGMTICDAYMDWIRLRMMAWSRP